MAELKYPRFNTIYNSREEALIKLKEISRSYGEPVTIRYYNNDKTVCIILAIYKSELIGDFEISYDSNPELQPKVYSISKNNPDISDIDYINSALSGKIPVIGDIVIITDICGELPITKSFIYTNGDIWKLLTTPSGSISSLDIGNTLTPVVKEDGSVDLEVKVDNSTIKYDDSIGGLTVGILNGGTF